ncbi:MAG: hypothetical protein ACI9U2_000133 [Bradymonadia bacterium]|jgi:hypothetical protein
MKNQISTVLFVASMALCGCDDGGTEVALSDAGATDATAIDAQADARLTDPGVDRDRGDRDQGVVADQGVAPDQGMLDPDRGMLDPDQGVEADAWTLDPRDPVEPIAPVDTDEFALPEWPADAVGDLLISVSGRGCLSVDRAAAVDADAVVSVDACRGVPGQRWILTDGEVHPEVAPALCLNGGGWESPITLAACADLADRFVLADDGVLERGGVALDVAAWLEVIVYGTHRGDNQRWQWLGEDVAFIAARPDPVAYPFAFDDADAYAVEEARHRVGSVQPPYPGLGARAVSAFPGDVSADAPPASRRVHLDRAFDHDNGYLRVAWPPQHWQSTGLYAPAGATIVVAVPLDANADGLAVRINVHTDVLRPTSGNVENGTFDRMPHVSIRVPLLNGPNAVRSPYGGTIILESTVDTGAVVPIDIHGAVAMPRYVLGVTRDAVWRERRLLGAPWAELESDGAVITVPASKIRETENPGEVMALYDRVVGLHAELFAVDGAGTDRPFDGKARFVEDRQISAGWGHSGFPIMTNLPWNLARLGADGDEWGVWHELGHNHQQFCLWSSRFGTESTVNLFSLHAQEAITGENRIADRVEATIAAVANGMTFDEADVWQKLVFLTQPVYAFEDRWAIYQRVHRAYRAFSDERAREICDSRVEKTSMFAVLLSEAAGHDLRGFFAAWGVPISPAHLAMIDAMALPPPPDPVEQARP